MNMVTGRSIDPVLLASPSQGGLFAGLVNVLLSVWAVYYYFKHLPRLDRRSSLVRLALVLMGAGLATYVIWKGARVLGMTLGMVFGMLGFFVAILFLFVPQLAGDLVRWYDRHKASRERHPTTWLR